MGQFARDWAHLKTLISQKDDAIEQQTATIAALQKQLASQPALDAEDQQAVAEVHQTASANPVAAAPSAAKPAAPAPATPPVAAPGKPTATSRTPIPAHAATPAVTIFSKP